LRLALSADRLVFCLFLLIILNHYIIFNSDYISISFFCISLLIRRYFHKFFSLPSVQLQVSSFCSFSFSFVLSANAGGVDSNLPTQMHTVMEGDKEKREGGVM